MLSMLYIIAISVFVCKLKNQTLISHEIDQYLYQSELSSSSPNNIYCSVMSSYLVCLKSLHLSIVPFTIYLSILAQLYSLLWPNWNLFVKSSSIFITFGYLILVGYNIDLTLLSILKCLYASIFLALLAIPINFFLSLTLWASALSTLSISNPRN